MKCPFCPNRFATLGAVTLHLETGRCPSGITKLKLDKYITSHDAGNVITIPGRMIGNGNGYGEVETYATERSWNGYAYGCYFCDKTCGTLQGLNRPSCGFTHRNLSGLVQHIESRSCGALMDNRLKNFLPNPNSMMIGY
jgi:hypothetical protein